MRNHKLPLRRDKKLRFATRLMSVYRRSQNELRSIINLYSTLENEKT